MPQVGHFNRLQPRSLRNWASHDAEGQLRTTPSDHGAVEVVFVCFCFFVFFFLRSEAEDEEEGSRCLSRRSSSSSASAASAGSQRWTRSSVSRVLQTTQERAPQSGWRHVKTRASESSEWSSMTAAKSQKGQRSRFARFAMASSDLATMASRVRRRDRLTTRSRSAALHLAPQSSTLAHRSRVWPSPSRVASHFSAHTPQHACRFSPTHRTARDTATAS
mmetsp:Transcript_28984/g.93449  ORF Transcript_28984/g.93449 Transcript_28984/m.93449 type:complete len:219 (+) Transcript_28984:790-1446(+)